MTTVADIMSQGVMTIGPDAPIDTLTEGLHETGIDGAPVMDGDGHVLGIVSKTDLLDPDRLARHADKPRNELTVEDVMTPVVVAVRTIDTALHAVERMVELGVHRVLVVDEHDHPVGIVSTMDVMRALLEGRLGPQEQDAREQDAREQDAREQDATE